MNKIIFFGNGPLADAALAVIEKHFEVIFHARTKEDLMQVAYKNKFINLQEYIKSMRIA